MKDSEAHNMSSKIRTNLIWILIVNIALVILYMSVSNKIHPSDFEKSLHHETYNNKGIIHESNQTVNRRIKPETYPDKVVSGDCTGLLFPAHLSPEVTWRPVNTENSAYVFSMYHLKEKSKLVIIGAKVKDYATYYCQMWYSLTTNRTYHMVQNPARAAALPEGHGKRYSASIFECQLQSSNLPDYVSVVNESCGIPLHILNVVSTEKKVAQKRLFTVCLAPFNFNYDDDSQLIEWIELNRILGAKKFIIYDFSSSVSVKRVLEFYSKRGLTEVVPWQLPMAVDTYPAQNISADIHYFGQLASLNDCLYRNKNISEFIVNLDLDEFIIPQSEEIFTWLDMLKQLYQQERHAFSAYLFRNTFFCLEWNNSLISTLNTSFIKHYNLITLQKLEHDKNIFPARIRSKYFARTSRVSNIMIHDILMIPYKQHFVVPPTIGLLHYYRNCEDLFVSSNERKLVTTVMDSTEKL
ncbi:uncharacterized protein LOC132726006 [Ruditapes philippinarum]|uniref:uncharacterized protein LOC132726006 n=1 Tax=Ruditapes philippinarum TaxID=129788 RepID=UPI00295B09AC|nr:uncharacterized protein LOC132726006 [Ruditapes philippinarum]